IRDRTVTGVQTCALPISRRTRGARGGKREPRVRRAGEECGTQIAVPARPRVRPRRPRAGGDPNRLQDRPQPLTLTRCEERLSYRSEEPRVGKEYRPGGGG